MTDTITLLILLSVSVIIGLALEFFDEHWPPGQKKRER